MVPSDVVKVTTVPFCTGVPEPLTEPVVTPLPLPPWVATPFSKTVATIWAWLLRDTEFVSGSSVILLPVGASNGTLSHDMTSARRPSMTEQPANTDRRCATIECANNSSLMSLRGQGGYAMAALLVGLAVMAVLMSVALPVWRQQARRQKEDELIWRGNQYVRAIRLYQAKFASLPPGVDVLVDGHFLRKKFKDPITNDDFDLLGAGSGQPGLPPGQGQAAPGRAGQTTTLTTTSAMGTPPGDESADGQHERPRRQRRHRAGRT